MNVFILIGSDGCIGENIEGVFLTLEEAVNKSSSHIRIEEHSIGSDSLVAVYIVDGELVRKFDSFE